MSIDQAILDEILGDVADAVAVVDGAGTIRYLSPAVGSLLGIEPSRFVGRSASDFVDPEDERALRSLLSQRSGSIVPVEILVLQGDDQWRPLVVSSFRGPRLAGAGFVGLVLRDAKDRPATLDALRQRLAFEDLLTRVSASFIERPSHEIDACIEDALADAGKFTKVDRANFCRLHDDGGLVELGNEWCAPGIESILAPIRTLPQASLPRWLKILRKPDVIYLPRLAEMGPAWDHDRAVFDQTDARSLLAAPVLHESELVGFVTFESVTTERMWSDDHISVLTSLAGILSQALSRRDAEERFGLAFTNAPLGMALHGPDGRHLQVNPAYCELLGRDEQEILGRRLLDFVADEDHQQIKDEHRRLLKAEADQLLVEVRFPRKDGTEVWGSLHAAPVRSADGILRYTVTHLEDVTQRHQRQTELRSSEQRYRTLVENSPNVVMRFDPDLKLVYVSHALHDLIGVDPDALLSQTEDLLTQGVEGPRWRQALESVIQSGRRLDREWELVIGGQHFWFQSRAVAELDGNGEVEHVLVVHSDITALKRSEAELAHQALHDPLTGLANRALLLDHLRGAIARAARSPGSLVLLFLDLDRFKLVNDSLGHRVGDELLVVVAERLQRVVRPGDTVARLGGDEFVVLLEDVTSSEETVDVANRIKRVMAEPAQIGSSEVFTTASIGIAWGEEATDAEGLLRDADSAMYLAKARGRNRYEVFDETLRTEATAKLQMESSLRRAIDLVAGTDSTDVEDQGGLCVFFQPEIDLRTGRILGAEALARWQHPTDGLLDAGAFIELAEESGLIIDLGAWVLRKACELAGSWHHQMPEAAEFNLRVNLSARQIAQADIVSIVVEALEAADLPASRLCLEITETALMQDPTSALRVLTDLRALGVELAVDDFGTGYSSLAYLKRFPVDVLKIDRSFVDGLGDDAEDTAIVAAIIGMARALGLSVVAEGVETASHLAELQRLGCERAQGFLFSRPVPVHEFVELVSPFDVRAVASTGVDS